MKNVTQKHSRLRRYGHLNMSHFLLLGAEGGGGELIRGTVRYIRVVDDAMQFTKWTNR